MICWANIQLFYKDPHFVHLFNDACQTSCRTSDEQKACQEDLRTHCPPLFAFPAEPIAFGGVRLVYSWNQTFDEIGLLPQYLCYSEHLCGRLSATIELRLSTDPSALLSCQLVSVTKPSPDTWHYINSILLKQFLECSVEDKDTEDLCDVTTAFRCGKKCISKHRLVDGFRDCVDNSDETFNGSCALNDKHRQPYTSMSDGVDRCYIPLFAPTTSTSDSNKNVNVRQHMPHFPTICDGYVEFQVAQDTDETDCGKWLCDNQYTRCDYVWNCPNGQDEAHCSYSPCELGEHPCLSMNTTQLICLPLKQAGDGIVDCWGAQDERQFSRSGLLGKTYLCKQEQTTNKPE